jgi:hypothetical protein
MAIPPQDVHEGGSRPRRQRGALDGCLEKGTMASMSTPFATVALSVDAGGLDLGEHDRGTNDETD